MSLALFYPEMNQAVPGATMSPGQEGGYGECQVPSPSQWSDPCYSPQSFHSPQHMPGDLEKVKEEPFPPSPVPTLGTYPPSPPSTQGSIPPSPPSLHHISPYARPQPTKKEGFETSLNLRELVAETTTLTNLHSPPTYNTYSDHPLLRGRLEDNTFQKKMSAPTYKSPQVTDCLGFLDMLVDVKQEVTEEEVCTGSSCGSPASPPQPAAQPTAPPQPTPLPQPTTLSQAQPAACQRDILETVEHLALEHARQNVQRVSDSLNIPHDPAHWSVEDVKAWLELQAAHLHLPPLVLNLWNMGGPALLKLTESQFRQLAPIGGELLYAQLEIWRGALNAAPKLQQPYYWNLQQPEPAHQQQLYSYVQQQQQQQVPQLESPTQIGSPHVGSPGHMGSPMHVGSPSQLSSPSSPPMSLTASMAQVPTPVVQVTQQQQRQQQHLQAGGATTCQTQTAGPSPQPAQQQQQQASGTVYLEEQCQDMAALLQQTTSPKAAHPARLPAHSPQDDVFDSEEEAEEESCGSTTTGRGGTHIHLWQFLKELLQQPQLYGSCIRWLDRQKGVFKIEDSVRVARLWGKRKNRPAMNYDKLSRSIRQYYKKGIMKKTERSQRLVYQFCNPYNL